MKSRFIPLRVLGERLVAAGMDQDDADLYVLQALKSGDLLATGVSNNTFDGRPLSAGQERESIRRVWWRFFTPLSYREAGTFTTVNSAAGYHLEPPPSETLEAMVKAKLIDRANDPITGKPHPRQWCCYRFIQVEAAAADYLVESCGPARQSQPARSRGRPPNAADQQIIDRIVSMYGAPQKQLDDIQLSAWINRHIAQIATEIDRDNNSDATRRRIKPKVLRALRDRR